MSRKKHRYLSMPKEQFFMLCLMEVGKPKPPAFFEGNKYDREEAWAVGGSGFKFLEVYDRVAERAGRNMWWPMYKKYYAWYKRQENKRAREEKAAQSL